MSKSKKRRSGLKGQLKKTRNQLRKEAYAAMREKTWKSKPHRHDPTVGIHKRPCGNPACRECHSEVPAYLLPQ